ncbi:MAG: WG repeat-containing protein [Candidatus Kapabacteria bacterium]|nr:WG repeat-containing protein [Ignavibacteriota bacterium]MCW5885671.1 WG repeat-containing protein [Candidatus Kapabacteria bacterium]
MKKFLQILLVSIIFANIGNAISKPLAAYKVDNLWYIIDEEGKAIFNPINLKFVAGYSEGFYKVYLEIDSIKIWGFMNDKGEVAVPMCDDVRLFRNGMAMISDLIDKDSELRLFGFINKEGKMIVPKEFLDAVDYSEGLAWVMNRDYRGYVDTTGKMVIPWDTTGFGSAFNEGLAAMTNKDDRFGFINKKGEVVIPYQYDEVTNFVNGLARVNILGKWGFINQKGELEIEADYDFALDFVEGFCFVGVPERNATNYKPNWGIINRGGGKVVDFRYEDIRDFHQGLGAVLEDGKWKIIDYFGNKVVEKEFDNIESFRDGLAWAVDGDKSGFIDPTGEFNIVIPEEAEVLLDLRLNKLVKNKK